MEKNAFIRFLDNVSMRLTVLGLKIIRLLSALGIVRNLWGFVFAIALSLGPALAQPEYEAVSGWKVAKKERNLTLMYRWVRTAEGKKTRQVRFELTVKADAEDLIFCLSDSAELTQWKAGVRKSGILDRKKNSWVTYTQFDIPKIFGQQDLVAKYTVEREPEQVIIRATASPDYTEREEGVERQERYEEYWILRNFGEGVTGVEFSSIAASEPVVPRFIQDKFTQPVLIQSFDDLRKRSERRYMKRNP
ncbi:hypothetical protein FUAX_09430 [Fulvitalea axinellae]|uniref:START domain-containing protein n=2 Tax=Fulvitalea axinellae TaxID=1182444 RepID=A0AAU9C8Q7_9BACT|nr:hypothetical protein FUAX_09430 [Fulvitalea axinellae]